MLIDWIEELKAKHNKAEPVSDVTIETDRGEREKSEEDGVDELCALKDAITEEEKKEKSEEEGVDEFCALKDALTDREENEKSEEDGDEYCAFKDALEEATTFFQSIGKYQQKLMLQKLTNLGAQRKKEWMASTGCTDLMWWMVSSPLFSSWGHP
ncbi:unnamed protein product [Eruca vesicaria subsp. sativa]|uniref:Uncharacterized protein n=1 Tax=Eruca vesicaria subsp. sativa TaxID=29727 RepID=A0ABC8JEK7_ERUVS|nr:unnamed protein product [Eruca vesicaria subsp. sativa]